MKSEKFTKAILIFIISCLLVKANAQWSTTVDVDNALHIPIYNGKLSFCSDGHGGAIYTWFDQTNNLNTERANRIDSAGYIRWGSTGVQISANLAGYYGPSTICEDGKGGCYVSYTGTNITNSPLLCQHLDSNGIALWNNTGIQPFAYSRPYQQGQTSPALVNDNGNGVFIVGISGVLGGSSYVLAQRLNINGITQWDSGGVFIDSLWSEQSPQVVADGQDGIAMIWFEQAYNTTSLKMQRLNHDGIPRFTGGYKYLQNSSGFDGYAYYKMIRTSNNNFIATWVGIASGGLQHIFTQKLDSSGTFLWPGSGIVVDDTTGGKEYPDLMSDGSDGAYYLWVDGRKINIGFGAYAQHIDAAGTTKWLRTGLQLDSLINGNGASVYLAPDTNNGIKTFYVDESLGSNQEYMQVVNSSGVKQLPGIGTAISPYGHSAYGVQPASNNHDIVFLGDNGSSFTKYVPFVTSTLAVNFTSFKASLINRQVQLTWQTANEINNTGFDIERSTDNMRFSKLAFQPAGNAIQPVNNYSFIDDNPFNGNNFYRLKQIDNDGKFTYSIINKVELLTASSLQVYPNPAVTQATIQFQLRLASHTSIIMYDIDGKEVKTIVNTNLEQGVHTQSISTANLTKGIYFIKISSDEGTECKKLVVE